MLTRCIPFVALICTSLLASSQTGLSNGSPSALQNFDGMGASLTLPADWRMHASTTAASWSAASAAVTAQASSGSPAAGGTYNWGTSAVERSVGAMTSSTFASPNNLLGWFSNTGSTSINSITISYQAERYRVNTAVASVSFSYSFDGSTWTPVAAGNIAGSSFPTGASAYTMAAPLTIVVPSFTINPISIAPGSGFYLRWNINTTGSNSQGIGIDEVLVSATFVSNSPTVEFTVLTSSVTEGSSASVAVRLNTAPPDDVVVTVSDALSGSAASGIDYPVFNPTQLTFLATGAYPMTQNVTVPTTHDIAPELNETIGLSLAVNAGTVGTGFINHTVSIADNDATITGCSSSQSPYMVPLEAGAGTTSILTVGDQIGGYKMVGAPDGLGAFDNHDGTFTLLMNHELSSTVGVARAHGSIGAFVSKWTIDKSSLCVVSGQDLITSVRLWNGTTFVTGNTTFSRFCSADQPPQSAYYNPATGKGTLERIYMNGEEAGVEGRGFAHIVTGPNAGTSFQLPCLGRFNWENALASATASDKTVVVGTDDATPGQVYIYIGTKQHTGSEVEKAGLHNGHLFGVAVSGLTTEVSGSFPAPNTPFSLIDLGDVRNLTGAQLNTNSNAAGVTNFLRPEDGAWDPANPSDFYFNTTNSFSSPSRMWRLRFTDPLQPELGGTITAVLDGTEGQRMLDNMTIDGSGHILMQEDVGNNAHNAKVWRYDIATDVLSLMAQHDPARFITGGALFLTQNEESSGILDVSHILGAGKFLISQMAHYTTTTELVEGGQLVLLTSSSIASACVPPSISAIGGNTALCATDTLLLNATVTGTPPINYEWTGAGTLLNGMRMASLRAVNASSGAYAVNVSNGCGSASGSTAVSVTPLSTWFADADGDTFGDAGQTLIACDQPTGYVLDGTDDCPSVPGRVGDACNDGDANTTGDALQADCSCGGSSVMLGAKVLLEGPYDGVLGLMNDALRVLPDFPLSEPFTAMGLGPVSGEVNINPTVLTGVGNDAIVDWVLVELRDAIAPSSVLLRTPGLLQRDGDVVALNGSDLLTLPAVSGSYHVALRHRNHLGAMTAAPLLLTASSTTLDLTDPVTATFGSNARKITGPAALLWQGDESSDGLLKYTGTGNDRDPILIAVGGVVPTNTVQGYRGEDLNLDGVVKYTGINNDRDPILVNIGGSVPTNVRAAQLP